MVGIREFTRAEIPWLSTCLLTLKVTVDATTVDAGNTGQTHILRSGLMVSENSTTSNFTEYRTGGSAGEGDVASYIMLEQTDLKGGDPGATAIDRVVTVLAIGSVVAGQVLLQDAGALVDLAKAGGGLGWIEFV